LARGVLEISADILKAALVRARKSHIAYRANLNPKYLKEYLDLLTKSGLIEKEGKMYKTTWRGKKFLNLFVEINEYLKPLGREDVVQAL